MRNMKSHAKKVYENMVDFKRFATILLAIGAFLYLGLIIPFEKSVSNQYVMIGASLALLFLSLLFFIRSKVLFHKLLETEEGQEFLMKK